ncbi:aminoacyl-tRNA hydrolase [bacterium]|nr:aminoacyl-tRNA hydrolase [bacterium]
MACKELYIVGLGNPGPEYIFTRHNAGFIILDFLEREYFGKFKYGFSRSLRKTSISIEGQSVTLIKPQTFMNRSGTVLKNLNFEKNEAGEITNLLVVFDDLHLPLGSLRYREQGSAGGHNGVKSIISNLGTNCFDRLRIGICPDKPINNVHNFVLGNFTKNELNILSDTLITACESIGVYIKDGISTAMNLFNSKAQ